MLEKKMLDLDRFNDLKGSDLKRIAGISLPDGGVSGKAELFTLGDIASIREKFSAVFPSQEAPTTTLQSVAILADGNVIFSITGNLTTQVKFLVEKIAVIVRRDGLNGAYFPAFGTEKVQFYIGQGATVTKLPEWMKSVQPFKGLTAMPGGVVFTDDLSNRKTVKKISLDGLYRRAWTEAKIIGEVPVVLYLDRVENDTAVVTTVNGIFTFNIKTGNINKVLIPDIHDKEKPSAVLRLCAGVTAFMSREGISMFPPRALESRGISQAC